eukprot:TRINITY_DN1215_c0_g1_i1.p2 TRINITY_DN1215_c0_g1~~TRINITY_DN1215_c0_g1_i1.p2  ORF type:complete len:117 (+),score=30.45 TRINITY_DN1215_c0_g1_i1:183-533(+)
MGIKSIFVEKIGKCDRWGCQYGIADVRTKDKKHKGSSDQDDEDTKEQFNGHHKGTDHDHTDHDIHTLLNNMHVVLLHGVDDEDGEKDITQKELYDLLPTTPMSPQTGFLVQPPIEK